VNGWALVAWALGVGVGLAALSQVLFLPFHQNYVDFFGGFVPAPETTPAFQWLIVFGVPTVVLLALVWTLVTPRRVGGWTLGALRVGLTRPGRLRRFVALRERFARGEGWDGALLVAAGGALLASLIAGQETWSARAWLLALLILGLAAAWRVRDRPLLVLPVACLTTGALLTLLPELVAVRGDIGRLNTVFKTYYQAWMLLGLGAAIALPLVGPRVWERTGGRRRWARALGTLGLVGLLGIAFIYPVVATPHKLGLRIQDLPPTLDGEAFMQGGSIEDRGKPVSLSSDKAAIDWLRRSVPGAPTVVEGPTTIYRWGARVSVYTGLPGVVGWDWHARQQHWGYVHAVDARLDDVQALFATTSPVRARQLLDRYGVDLIYVGELERAWYSDLELGKFDEMAALGVTPIYRNGPVTIYRVLGPSSPTNGPASG
jgi:uncharacterized membrane protein